MIDTKTAHDFLPRAGRLVPQAAPWRPPPEWLPVASRVTMTVTAAPHRRMLEPIDDAVPPSRDRRARRRSHPCVDVAVVAAGGAMAVFVGHSGTPAWQLIRALGVVGITSLLYRALGHADRRLASRISVAVGIMVLAVGFGFVPYLVKNGARLVAAASVLAVAVGLVLVIIGTAGVLRSASWWRRVLRVGATVVATAVVLFVVSPSVMATNVPRPEISETPSSEGLDYQAVTLTTSDGVELAAWYLPSRNRAAIVLRHGAGSTRSNGLDHAAVLVRHGFGVLLVDARGHGESDGRAMDFGWYGDVDITAAVEWLTRRPEVDPTRIGLVGMSMGAEEAIGASATNGAIAAVVAEGATARVADDEAWLSDVYGIRGLVQEQLERGQDLMTGLLTTADRPASMHDAVATTRTTRYLLIAAGNEPDEANAAEYIASAAPGRVDRWVIAGASHTSGLRTSPDEWDRRVLEFLNGALDLD